MIELRRIVETDLQKIFMFRNDSNIWQWCRQNDVLHWENHLKWYHKQAADPSISMYAIHYANSHELVGVCGLTSIDLVNSRAEFSLLIGSDYQKKGYGKAAMRALFRKGFDDYNLNLIWGESFEGNPAIEMFKKFGMTQDGIRRRFYFRGGIYLDAYLFSMTRREFTWN